MARYEFIIKNETGGGGSQNSPTAPTTNSGSTQDGKHGWLGLDETTSKGIAKGIAAVGVVSSFAFQTANNRISTTTLRTGQAEYQAKQELALRGAKWGMGILTSAATGLFVSGGNPLGAVAGALVGVAHTAINMQQAANVVQMERSAESIGIELANIRAGSLGDRHGRGGIS